MAIGGSIESVSIGGRPFTVASDADATRDLGGYTSETRANGDGTTRDILTRKPWKITGLTLSIDDLANDQEFLQENAGGAYKPIDITYASGVTYQGLGKVTGDLAVSSQSTTGTIELSGSGELTKQ